MGEVPALVVMGVSGAGKSLVGEKVAQRIGGTILDADGLHPRSNVEKMASGQPLDDADRLPWLKLVAQRIASEPGPLVVACSALKRSYRDTLSEGNNVVFVLLDGDRDILLERLKQREGHFMPASLLASQLDTLEPLEMDELGILVDVAMPLEHKVELISEFWQRAFRSELR